MLKYFLTAGCLLAFTLSYGQLFDQGNNDTGGSDDDYGMGQDTTSQSTANYGSTELPQKWQNPKYSEPQYGNDWTELSRPEKVRRLTGADNEEAEVDGINPHSVYPINKSDQMTRLTVWRQINFKERANLGFYAKGQRLFDVILEGVVDGSLRIFETDSLVKEKDRKDALSKLIDPNFGTTYDGADIYIATLREDVIFDKKRSRQYYDIQSIQFYVPPDVTAKGILDPLFVLRYKDLVEYFKDHPRAFWYNSQNNAENRNFADAFDLRLFNSRIEKISNAKDEALDAVYGKDYLFEAYKMDQTLVDKESVLWSY